MPRDRRRPSPPAPLPEGEGRQKTVGRRARFTRSTASVTGALARPDPTANILEWPPGDGRGPAGTARPRPRPARHHGPPPFDQPGPNARPIDQGIEPHDGLGKVRVENPAKLVVEGPLGLVEQDFGDPTRRRRCQGDRRLAPEARTARMPGP